MSSDLTIFKNLPDGTTEYREPAQTRVTITHPKQKIAISGSWRNVMPQVREDVIHYTRQLIKSGHTLVTGGALGVDYEATAEALRISAQKHQIHVILPTPLEVYIAHFIEAARKNPQLVDDIQCLITQLLSIKENYTLTEMDGTACNEETYYARNGKVIDAADRLAAFHVDGSAGVQDAIDKARARNLPVTHITYTTRPKLTEPVIIEE